jgi:hypothetical protein
MDVQSAANLNIPEGSVRNIHDKDKRLLWSAVGYNVRYGGDTTQQTYTGKNKMPVQSVDLTDNRIKEFVIALPAGTYTYSFDLDSFEVGTNSNFSIYSQFYLSNGTLKDNNISGPIDNTTPLGRKSYTFTLDVDAIIDLNHLSNIRIPLTQYNNGARASISNIMIESGSPVTAYEPYVGGSPAPNPDYPQDVNVVQGKQTILVSDRNLLEVPDGTKHDHGMVWTRSNNTVSGTGTLEDATYSNIVDRIDLNLPPGKYTFSIAEALPSPLQVEFSTRDNNGTRVNYRIPENSTSATINFANGLSWTAISLVRGTIDSHYDLTIKDLQLDIGDTTTTFEQPQSKTVNFDLRGKNLFDNTKSEAYISKASLQTISNGIRAITTTSSNSATFAVMIVGKVEDFLGDKITLSYSSAVSSSSNTARVYIGLCDANGNNRSAKTYISATENGVGTYNIGNTIDSTRPYLCLAFYSTTTTTTVGDYVDYNNVQLEIGDAATTYQPYHAPIELCKIGNYQDYIYKGADGWYMHKEIGEQTLGNSAITSIASNYTNIEYAKVNKPVDSIIYNNTRGYSNVAVASFATQQVSTSGGYDNPAFIGKYILQAETLQYYVGFPKNTGLGNIQTILNGEIFYCALATPTNTKITDTTITSQLDAIHDWLTRYDYYDIVTGNLPMIINRTGLT